MLVVAVPLVLEDSVVAAVAAAVECIALVAAVLLACALAKTGG